MSKAFKHLVQAVILTAGCLIGGLAQAGVALPAAEETGRTTVP